MSAVAVTPVLDLAGRVNIYTVVHKGLRGFMLDTLLRIGRMDVSDSCEVGEALAQLRSLLAFCLSHIEHENAFLHPALEKARAGASAVTAHEHEEHFQEISALQQHIAFFEQGTAQEKRARGHRLYLQLTRFVGENFEHMSVEETANHRVLATAYTDSEIQAIDAAIVATIPPPEMAVWLRWMIGCSSAGERAALLGGIKANAPAEVFDFAMGIARDVLSERDRYKLELALS